MNVAGSNVRVLEGHAPRDLPIDELLAGEEPVVLKNLAGSWPIVAAGSESDEEAVRYLSSFDRAKPISTAFVPPAADGRLYYNSDFTELNFHNENVTLTEALRLLAGQFSSPEPQGIYIASAILDTFLPGFRAENDLGFEALGIRPRAGIWIGNRVTASCHYDAPHNLACCVVGRRRFTLFPPDQIQNLYPGPLEPTPGGQAISLVDFSAPDLDRFPRFALAMEQARVVELSPGDALYIPSVWWHHVRGLEKLNVLVNYWWSVTPQHIPSPANALQFALWAIRNRPESERLAWKAIFDYYVFGPSGTAVEHLPLEARGDLGKIDETRSRRIRAKLINELNR